MFVYFFVYREPQISKILKSPLTDISTLIYYFPGALIGSHHGNMKYQTRFPDQPVFRLGILFIFKYPVTIKFFGHTYYQRCILHSSIDLHYLTVQKGL